MKVELLVNLKLGDGRIVSAGSVYSDKLAPIPDFVMRRLRRGMARIVETDPVPPASKTKEPDKKVEDSPKDMKKKEKTSGSTEKTPSATKKVLKKNLTAEDFALSKKKEG